MGGHCARHADRHRECCQGYQPDVDNSQSSGHPLRSVSSTRPTKTHEKCVALSPNSFAITDGATPMATGVRGGFYLEAAATIVSAYAYGAPLADWGPPPREQE